MWKECISFVKSVAASYKRLAQADENIKKLQARADKTDNDKNDAKITLLKVLNEFDKVRMQMENGKQNTAAARRASERDYENLVLRLENAMLKSADQRALPPGSNPQNTPEPETRIAALERGSKRLKSASERWKMQNKCLDFGLSASFSPQPFTISLPPSCWKNGFSPGSFSSKCESKSR